MWGRRGPVRDALAYLQMQILKGLRMYTQRLQASTLLAAWIMDLCVARAARIITPPAWLCRSWSRLWFWASAGWGPAAVQRRSLWPPSFWSLCFKRQLRQNCCFKRTNSWGLLRYLNREDVWKHDALRRLPVSAVTFICSRLPFVFVPICIHQWRNEKKTNEHSNSVEHYSCGDPGLAETLGEFI